MKPERQRIRPAVLWLCGLLLLGLFAGIWAIPRLRSPGPVAAPEPVAAVEQPTQQPARPLPPIIVPPPGGKPPADWGIEVIGLYPSVGGRVLDLRYKVLDVAKASLLPDESGGIYLMDEATAITAKSLNVPKTGSIPQNPQKLQVGRTYSLGFPNPEGRFKSGSKVTVVIGGLRAEHLVVQ